MMVGTGYYRRQGHPIRETRELVKGGESFQEAVIGVSDTWW